MNKNIIIITGIVLVIIVAGGYWLMKPSVSPSALKDFVPTPDKSSSTITEAGSSSSNSDIPALTLKDYQGNTVNLADYQGKPLVINSWAVWCPFCVKELKDFVTVQKELGTQVTIIAIDRAEPRKTAQDYTDDLGISSDLIFLLDPQDSFYAAIGGFSMPETIFYDANGVLTFHKRGPMDADEIRRQISNLL